MILLDTNAVVWTLAEHPRAEPLLRASQRLFLSPVSLLELQFLAEVGRVHPIAGAEVADVSDDPRWELDDPQTSVLFRAALAIDWTRDPFDRLLVAHARARRWKLATGDRRLQERLSKDDLLSL